MGNLNKIIYGFFLINFFGIGNFISAQIAKENVDYIPEFDFKSVTIINAKDTGNVLFVTDSTIVVWLGKGGYDKLKLNDHLAVYKIEQVTSFYHRKKGYIIPKTIGYSLIGAGTGILLGAALVGDGEWDKLGGAIIGFEVGTPTGAAIGLLSGFSNRQKYDWRTGEPLSLDLKKVRKYQACSYIVPYHLYLAVMQFPLK